MNEATSTATLDAQNVPTDAEDSATADHRPTAEQQQPDPDSEEQLQHEAEHQDGADEDERLARLDLETEDDKAQKTLDVSVWGTTGHPVADEAMRTLQNVGLSTDDAIDLLLDAAMSRDPSMVDQKALAAKIGPRRTKAIMEGLENFSREMRPKDERVSNEVYQYANGPKALQRLIESGSEKLSASEMQSYLIEMGKGGSSAQRAVENLRAIVSGEPLSLDRRVHTEQYHAPKQAPRAKPEAGITSQAYVAAMDALYAPGSRLSFEARDRHEAELRAARRIGRENGLP